MTTSSSEKAEVLRELLGSPQGAPWLTADDLQANRRVRRPSSNEEEQENRIRLPTALAVLPRHEQRETCKNLFRNMTPSLYRQETVVVGFDSGEVQVYGGFRPLSADAPTTPPEIGAGFRVSDAEPVRFVRSRAGVNPFGAASPGEAVILNWVAKAAAGVAN